MVIGKLSWIKNLSNRLDFSYLNTLELWRCELASINMGFFLISMCYENIFFSFSVKKTYLCAQIIGVEVR